MTNREFVEAYCRGEISRKQVVEALSDHPSTEAGILEMLDSDTLVELAHAIHEKCERIFQNSRFV